jgi:hypothetical protein
MKVFAINSMVNLNSLKRKYNDKMKMQKLIEYKIKKKFDDRIEYYYNGERHRLNGPAIEYANGNKY